MSRRKTNSNDPADWLLFAEADMGARRVLVESRMAFIVCLSKCAEALEKLMKAELIHLGWSLVKTHDLQYMASELRSRSSGNADQLQVLAEELSEYYLTGRYPGFDLDNEEDWPKVARELEQIEAYGQVVREAIKRGHSR